MKLTTKISFIFILFTSTLFADDFNGKYEVVKYLSCNNTTINSSTPGDCSYNSWNGLDLDSITSLELSFSDDFDVLKLTDVNGVAWEKDMKTCVDRASRPFGCKAKISDIDGSRRISIKQWGMGPDTRVSITLKDDELIISELGFNQGRFTFEVEKVEE